MLAHLGRRVPSWKGVDVDKIPTPELFELYESIFGPLEPTGKRRLLEQAARRERSASLTSPRLAA